MAGSCGDSRTEKNKDQKTIEGRKNTQANTNIKQI
jgi:hypothetical protein